MFANRQNIRTIREIGVADCRNIRCGITEFVLWCIRPAGLVILVQNDWRDVGQPQVAMHRHCRIF